MERDPADVAPVFSNRLPAKLVLEDEMPGICTERVTLTLWVLPPSGLTHESEEATVRKAAIPLLERALEALKSKQV